MISYNVLEDIRQYVDSHPEPKRSEIQDLHDHILRMFPDCRLWFDDGKDEKGKVVANPAIGYGFQILRYANGKTKEFFRIGISGNTTGISVYILGIEDKKYLADTYGKALGKASVTGYCIKFKTVKDIHIEVLEAAIKYGLELDGAS